MRGCQLLASEAGPQSLERKRSDCLSYPSLRASGYSWGVPPTPRRQEVHRLVDRLPAGQIEALYVLLRGMVPDAAESPAVANDAAGLDDWHPSPDAPVVRNLSIAGIAVGDHDLGERSEEILRRELGHPGE